MTAWNSSKSGFDDVFRVVVRPNLLFGEISVNYAAQPVAVKKTELIHAVSVLYGILCELLRSQPGSYNDPVAVKGKLHFTVVHP